MVLAPRHKIINRINNNRVAIDGHLAAVGDADDTSINTIADNNIANTSLHRITEGQNDIAADRDRFGVVRRGAGREDWCHTGDNLQIFNSP